MKQWIAVLGLAAMGCGELAEVETMTVGEAELGRADAMPTLVGRGLRLGVGAIQPASAGWRVPLASNRPVLRWTASVGAYPVEVLDQNVLLDATALEELATGLPLVVEAEDAEGTSANVETEWAVRWTSVRGSKRLNLDRGLRTSVLPGGGVVVRARGKTEDGFSVESVFTDDDFEPEIVRDFDWRWEFVWNLRELPYLMDFATDRVHFSTVDSDDTRYASSARMTLKAVRATWRLGHAGFEAPPCHSHVRFCMHHLTVDEPFGDGCGSTPEILACFRADRAH